MAGVAAAEAPHQATDDFAGQPLGKIGIWWFLASEIMVFGGLIGTYLVSRVASGGWAAERAQLNTRIAAVNTLVLLTSSLTVVEAHAAAEANARGRARQYLLATVLLGCAFLGIKGYEYAGEIGHGITPARNLFWSFYYTLTGLHGLHVLAGILVNGALFVATGGSAWPRNKHRIEYAGLYWHFVDVVWIFLFPLLYLA